jgi:hypothetical protein
VRSLATAVALALYLWPAQATGEVRRFAIVIGNNHSARADTRDLRYADDDAVAMHQLLEQAGVDSSLFAALDASSRPLYPGLAPRGRPRWSALGPRLIEIEERIRAARSQGDETSLLIFYSGHGDVAHGEGYVELEDARLSRSLLRREILDRTAAGEVHLIVDACRSYYLAFEKGPAGRRRRAAAAPLADKGRAPTGYILSTSSDRDSHEWEAFQGGIFSHEVRSGLRGAADVDRDGRVTYAELGAFLSVANRGIRNPRFRPDFVVRPPADLSDELLRWGDGATALVLDRPGQGHMVLEGPAGERVLDVNAAPGQELIVRLPRQRPLFLRRAAGDVEFAIADGRGPQRTAVREPDARATGGTPVVPSIRLSALTGGPVRVASKGALHLAFAQLFSAPFGATDVDLYRSAVEHAGLDVRPDVTAQLPADQPSGWTTRRTVGVIAIGAGAVGVGLGGWSIERSIAARDTEEQQQRDEINGTIEKTRVAAGVALGVAASAAIAYWLLDRDDGADLLTIAPNVGVDVTGLALTGTW